VMVDHQYLWASVPPSKLRVQPGVVLATYLALVEIRLAGVQGHHLGLPFGYRKRQAALPVAEQILEMVIPDVVAVVVAGNHDNVLALQPIQVGLRRFKFLPVSLRGEIPGYGHEVGVVGVDLLYGRKDLKPHLSTKIADPDYQDLMFYDWRTYHFHLGIKPHPKRPGFVARTDELLFAMTDPHEDKMYLIDIHPHKGAFENQDLMRIVEADWPEILSAHEL